VTKASDNAFPSILITEGTEPSAPAAGKQRLYIDSTSHHLMRTNSSGTETDIEAAAANGLATDTLWDAKGDLVAATGANAASKLTVGSNGKILVAASGEATGVKWDYFPARHGCLIYHNTTQVTSANILANSEIYDSDGYHDTVSNTSRITIPTGLGGLYFMEYALNVTSLASGEFCRIRLNTGSYISANEGGTDQGYISGFCVYPLSAADYVEVWFTGNRTVGHASAYEAQFHFSATLLGV